MPSSIDTYLENNRKYVADFASGHLLGPPTKRVTVITCMDARVETAAMLGLKEGDANVIRNAGGVVTDDVVRSVTISQRLLGTREIMLIHHTDCGMLKFTDEELSDTIHKETGVKPHFAMESFPDLEDHMRRSLARLKTSPFIVHKNGIRGFIFEVETGRLREVT